MLAERKIETIDAPSAGAIRSFTGRRWDMRRGDDTAVRAIADKANISHTLANILVTRGVQPDDADDFLRPTLKRLLPEPFTLRNMETAVARMAESIERRQQIVIYGDYDVDGSASSAVLANYLSDIGIAARVYVPDRMTEGYGPNAAALLKLRTKGADLAITVDCGAAAHGPLEAAQKAGLDVIVLDHHAVEADPPAIAHVNPNGPGDTSGLNHVCAAGIVFLFLVALNRALRDSGWFKKSGVPEPNLLDSVGIVALATVCDVVPLIGINRAFVRAGLAKLHSEKRPGLAALAEIAKTNAPYTPYHLGYVFGPRINAGGRVGKCSLGSELLSVRDAGVGSAISLQLDRHNKERKAIESMILESAIALAAQQDNQPFILVAEDGWHHGVVGIVASRLKDRFGKPALVAGFEGGYGRGSARSIAGIDIGAFVRAAKEAGLIEVGGGHAMAAGFTITPAQLDPFRDFMADRFSMQGSPTTDDRMLAIDGALSLSAIGQEMVEELALAGPFGAGNPEPLFAVYDGRVVFADMVGKQHVRLRISNPAGALDAIVFRAVGSALGDALLKARGQVIHLAGRVRVDEWNGRKRVQMEVEDAAPAAG